MNSKAKLEFYGPMEELANSLIKFNRQFGNSRTIQIYCTIRLFTFAYATLIINFFGNLTNVNVKENNLPRGKIGKVKFFFHDEIAYLKEILGNLLSDYSELNRYDYLQFKSKIQKNFPEFTIIANELEKYIDIDYLEKFLKKKQNELEKNIVFQDDIDTNIMRKVIENFIENKLPLPISFSNTKKIGIAVKKSIKETIALAVKEMEKNSSDKIAKGKKRRTKFEKDLYQIWKIPLDLLELLISSSIEIGENQKNKLSDGKKKITNAKYVALIKIHARAVHIGNEIFSLLRCGYADGANARWRSLYELTAIFLVLSKNNEDLSSRYLEHETIKRFRNLKDYQQYSPKIGYKPINKKQFQIAETTYNNLLKKYDLEFRKDYGWITKNVLGDRNFKKLVELAGIDGYYSYYNMSSDSVHGGPAGFLRMGLMDNRQDKVFLVGPSVFGLADPIQNTAYCLRLINATYLALNPDLDNVLFSGMIITYFQDIGKIAVQVQKKLERESLI